MLAPGSERLDISPIPTNETPLNNQVQRMLHSGAGSMSEKDDAAQHRQNQSLTIIPNSQLRSRPERIDEVSHSRNEWEETLGESQMIAASHSLKPTPAQPMHGLKNV